MKLSLTQQQALHILKVAGYAGLSAAIAAIIALITANPLLFGALTPVINILLVTLEKLFEQPQAQ